MKDRPQVQDFDWVLLAIVAAINALGVLEIYSSTHASAMAGMQWKQLMWLGIGLICMFLISRVDYHTLLDQAPMLDVYKRQRRHRRSARSIETVRIVPK